MAYTNMINVIERYISNCQVMCHVPFIKQKANETMQVKKLFSRDTCTYGVPIFNIRYRILNSGPFQWSVVQNSKRSVLERKIAMEQ